MNKKPSIKAAENWFLDRNWKAHSFQKATWRAYLAGKNGIVNAPTGSGKTYSLWWAILLELMQEDQLPKGLQAIWITPIRALSEEIYQSTSRVVNDLNLELTIGIRTGDTPTKVRQQQSRKMPNLLITTPESLHLLLAQKGYKERLGQLKAVVVDEWHELIGSKRGVQIELALSRLKTIAADLKIWGISATIGNMDEAMRVLMGNNLAQDQQVIIKSGIKKKIKIKSIIPKEIEKFPWAGHLGIKLVDDIIRVVDKSESTLIFTNTRAQTEIWYQRLMEKAPHLAGLVAMHHGSISREIRHWVEAQIHARKLKAVVCTSSLDLGVDFRPVETIIQIGGPKGVARFVQRAGRSGHQPGATSTIYFAPTHSLELLEAAALRAAIDAQDLEVRKPYIRSFDVLAQYLVTLAVSEGFDQAQTYKEIKSTFCYESLDENEWLNMLNFIVNGTTSLSTYDEFKRVEVIDGLYKVTSRRIAMRHRLSMGTIVSDQMLKVKYLKGKTIGSVEEWFLAKLKPGDVFWFAGRPLELYRVKDNTVLVKRAKSTKGIIPSWQGGRMPLSSKLGAALRSKLTEAMEGSSKDPEVRAIASLLGFQAERSHVPGEDELLIEQFETKEGFHTVLYPFEGRFVHEGHASLLAWRLSQDRPATFSLGFNDYGLELLSDKEIDVEQAIENGLFSPKYAVEELLSCVNSTAMADRRFRDIASISGMVFQGYPGRQKKDRHIQASSHLIFEVLKDYEPENLLLRQAYEEVLDFQLEESRLRLSLQRMNQQKKVIRKLPKPSPFAFPIIAERIRERFTNEQLKDRIQRMKIEFE